MSKIPQPMSKIPLPGSDAAIEWLPIPGYVGRYEVSNDGRVRSMNWEGNTRKIKELKMNFAKGPRNKVGYAFVRLHQKGAKTAFVGRLVLSAFDRVPTLREEMNHMDGDTTNDNITNLEWVSSSENHKHAIRNGLMKMPSSLGKGKKYWWRHTGGRSEYRTCMELSRIADCDPAPFFKMVSEKPTAHKSFHGWCLSSSPNPGSDEAIRHSCCCAIEDNHYGEGCGWTGDNGEPLFWVTADCPLHGVKSE